MKMKKVFAIVLAAVMALAMIGCGKSSEDINKKSDGVLTFAEYSEKAADDDVVIEGYVQAYAYNAEYGNVNMFIQDGDGAYYAYRAVCSEDQAKSLKEGVKVKVTGKKAEWAGEIEIGEGCEFEVEDGSYIADATDVSDKLGAADVDKYQNMKVSVKGAVVEASTDGAGEEAAFLYNWDGSGVEGSNCDLYFNVNVNGATYTFTVESDEVAEGTEVYTAVTGLNVGDTIDLEGFLYWYEGAQLHVSGVTVK